MVFVVYLCIIFSFANEQESASCFKHQNRVYLSVLESEKSPLSLMYKGTELVELRAISPGRKVKCPDVTNIKKEAVDSLKENNILKKALALVVKI